MKNTRIAWIALAVALLGLLLSWQGRLKPGVDSKTIDNTLLKIKRDRKLRVAYITYPPTVFRDPTTHELSGHFIDTLKEILIQVDPKVTVEYEETTWADFATALNSGRVDLSIAGTFTTIPRAKQVAFTRPLVYLGRSVIIRKGDRRFSASNGPMQFDRSDVRVGVVDGEGSYEFVKANFKNQSKVTTFSGTDLTQCLAAVSSGQVDVGMSDAMEVSKYAKAHPGEVEDLFADNPYDITPVGWSVRQEDFVWKGFLDTAIQTLETQGKLIGYEHKYDYKWIHPIIDFKIQ